MDMQIQSANSDQLDMMKAFGSLLGSAIDLIVKHELGDGAELIVQKLQEAMFWHSHLLLNKPEGTSDAETPTGSVDSSVRTPV